MPNLKIFTLFKLILIISLISICTAYFIQHVLGYQPCNLCLIERIPYALSLVLIITGLIYKKHEKFIILLLILIFAFSFIISTYHLGIEQGLFKESTICGLKDSSEILSKEELLKILNERNISCKDVTFKILGFSLTTINMVISLILTILLIITFTKYGKFKKKG